MSFIIFVKIKCGNRLFFFVNQNLNMNKSFLRQINAKLDLNVIKHVIINTSRNLEKTLCRRPRL